MPNILKKLYRKKGGKEKIIKPPPMPALPIQRPNILTPTPSHEYLVASTPAESATTPISFLQRFPFEIRRKILFEAFGGQIVHMDISCDVPVLDHDEKHQQAKDPAYVSHANNLVRSLKRQSKYDTRKSKEWQWWSSVCHRSSPQLMGTALGDAPCEDNCAQGASIYCKFWPGGAPYKCYLGVMGWLLASRQAYAECIDVLYATNTIHVASTSTYLHLPQLLLPQRLASIKSMELRWHLHLYQNPANAGFFEFQNLMETLPSTFPHLQKLYLSLEGDIRPKTYSGKLIDISEYDIMRPVDDMIRLLGPRLQDCSIAIPLSIYDPRKLEATGKPVMMGWKSGSKIERLWRDLPQDRRGGVLDTNHLLGYWLCLGQIDLSATYIRNSTIIYS